MKQRLLTIFALIAIIAGCTQFEPVAEFEEDLHTPVIDSLLTIFKSVKQSIGEGNLEQAFAQMDPNEIADLQRRAEKSGFQTAKTYLRRQANIWPSPDTLKLIAIKTGQNYIRLTLEGTGSRFRQKRERISYSFVLFRYADRQWKLTAVAGIERDRFDPYGYELSYHETDLPPRLRFPRLF